MTFQEVLVRQNVRNALLSHLDESFPFTTFILKGRQWEGFVCVCSRWLETVVPFKRFLVCFVASGLISTLVAEPWLGFPCGKARRACFVSGIGISDRATVCR